MGCAATKSGKSDSKLNSSLNGDANKSNEFENISPAIII